MSGNKIITKPSSTGTPYVVWKEKPHPGPEQVELERLFNSGDILGLSPEEVRQSDELFRKFSPSVFNSHFRITKARLGKCATVAPTTNNAPVTYGSIPELSGTGGTGGIVGHGNSSNDLSAGRMDNIRFTNSPFWTWEYFDHERNIDLVCVGVLSLCGVRNVKFEIAEDGMFIIVHYTWPTAIYKAVELFKTSKQGNAVISMNHTKVHSFVANALKNGVSVNSEPRGEIEISLPRKVQRLPGSWKKEAISVEGTNIILLEMSAEYNEIVIIDADTSINF